MSDSSLQATDLRDIGTQLRRLRVEDLDGSRWNQTLRDFAASKLNEQPAFQQSRDLTPLEWSRSLGVQGDLELQCLARYWTVDYIEAIPQSWKPWSEFLESTPISLCRRHQFIGLVASDPREDIREPQGHAVGPSSVLLLSRPESLQFLDLVGRWLNTPLRLVFCSQDVLLKAIDSAYEHRTDRTTGLLSEIGQQVRDVTSDISEERDDLLESGQQAPVIQLVNSLLFEAVRATASDVHIQPVEDCVTVRMRIDGILFDTHTLPKAIQEEVLTRIKVLGRMNIAEKRLPQDGRATVQVGQRLIDLRIASMPTSFGERIVIRLLDKGARLYTLQELGMDAGTLERYRRAVRQEHGLVLVTGPTGSGKSTTLYASLMELDTRARNAVTLEDPIEYELSGISQTQINTRKGMSFASGLRSILRQDPDIIMLGEIRDAETAVMAIQASLTGHMVFSTLHTNDAPSAVTRLLDLGIEPYLAASSLLAVLAQRLVRKICPHCKSPCHPTQAEQELLTELVSDQSPYTIYHGNGCDLCRGTGYRGRLGVFELLTIDDQIQSLITQRTNAAQIRTAALKNGMLPMRTDGLQKVLSGKTTIEEIARVTVEIH